MMTRLPYHLGKVRLIEWTPQPLKPPLQILRCVNKLFRCVILFDFTNNKTFFHGGPRYSVTQGVLTYQSIISANTYLEWNRDEHPQNDFFK